MGAWYRDHLPLMSGENTATGLAAAWFIEVLLPDKCDTWRNRNKRGKKQKNTLKSAEKRKWRQKTKWSEDILPDFEIMSTGPHNTCLTSSWSRKKRLGAFAGTETDGDKPPRSAVLVGRSAAVVHCFALLAPLIPAPSCSPMASTHAAVGTSRWFSLPCKEPNPEKPHGQTQPLPPRANAKPKVRVRLREKAASTAQLPFSAAWEGQVYSTEKAPEK